MKLISFKRTLLILLLTMTVGIPSAFAVTETTLGGELVAEITPPNPGPLTTTTIVLQNSSLDLQSATIIWSVNGREVRRGIGEKSFTFETGKGGTKTTIFTSVEDPAGNVVQKSLVFIPQELDVLWETNSYTPSLYPGKPLPTRGAHIRLLAIPRFKTETGREIAPNNLFYSWKQEGTGILNQNANSGIGMQTFSVTAGISRKVQVSVTVSNTEKTFSAQKTTIIDIVDPFITVHEEKPLEGKGSIPLQGPYTIPREEVTLRAEPFFFSQPVQNISPQWNLGNELATPDNENPWLITLRKTPSARGTTQLSVSAIHPDFRFQSSRQTLGINF